MDAANEIWFISSKIFYALIHICLWINDITSIETDTIYHFCIDACELCISIMRRTESKTQSKRKSIPQAPGKTDFIFQFLFCVRRKRLFFLQLWICLWPRNMATTRHLGSRRRSLKNIWNIWMMIRFWWILNQMSWIWMQYRSLQVKATTS